MKAYVGIAKAMPDSRTPRRLTSVISTTAPIESSSERCPIDGTADTIASTPAATDTATVST